MRMINRTLLAFFLMLLAHPETVAEESPVPRRSGLQPRLLHVRYTSGQHKSLEPDNSGVTVFAGVKAHGFRGETLVGTARLRGLDGRPVLAAKGAPKEFQGEGGVFQSSASDKILYDEAAWNAFHVEVPLSALELPGGVKQKLILSFTASCKGFSSTAESELVVPAPEKEDLLPAPGIEIVGLKENPSAMVLPVVPAVNTGPNPAGMGLDFPGRVDTTPLPILPGLMLNGHVKAQEMAGQSMTAEIRLRTTAGKPVLVAEGAMKGYADKEGRFASQYAEKMEDTRGEWDSLPLWIPFGALALEQEKEHRLIVTFRARAGRLAATMEQELVLSLPQTGARGGTAAQEQTRDTEAAEPEILIEEGLLESLPKGVGEVLELLTKDKANVLAPDAEGRTPLHIAAEKGQVEALNLLIAAGVSATGPEKPDQVSEEIKKPEKGSGPFDFSPEYLESISFDKYLEDTRRTVNVKDKRGATPLHLAAANGQYDAADLLITFSADVNAANQDGRTPLHEAAAKGDDAIVALLLLKGADPSIRDKNGKTSLDLATSASIKQRLQKAMESREDPS
jgi:ankyrin repeat protein